MVGVLQRGELFIYLANPILTYIHYELGFLLKLLMSAKDYNLIMIKEGLSRMQTSALLVSTMTT